jgi:hypothetical protein
VTSGISSKVTSAASGFAAQDLVGEASAQHLPGPLRDV